MKFKYTVILVFIIYFKKHNNDKISSFANNTMELKEGKECPTKGNHLLPNTTFKVTHVIDEELL